MKLALIIGGSLLTLIIIVAAFSGNEAVNTGESVPGEEKAVTKEKKVEQKPGKAEFDQVKSGMTIEEVQKILGPGVMDAESESGDIKMQMFSWQAQGDLGANISVSFTNGKSDSKAQSGIK